MKIRTGFVSNSSSTSFTCDVCGETWSGWDGDYGISTYMCENGHCICEEDFKEEDVTLEDLIKYYKSFDDWADWIKEDTEKYIKNEDRDSLLSLFFYEDCQEIPKEFCPLCTFKYIAIDDMNRYLRAKLKMNNPMIRTEMRERFKKYGELQKFCNDNIP